MSTDQATHGLDALKGRSLIETIWRRRTHRVSRGSDVAAGPMSYKSPHPRAPLSPLEEAGPAGAAGRTAGSPDNAQGTSFFLINDSGTYFLRKLPPVDGDPFDPALLLERAEMAKVKLLDGRIA